MRECASNAQPGLKILTEFWKNSCWALSLSPTDSSVAPVVLAQSSSRSLVLVILTETEIPKKWPVSSMAPGLDSRSVRPRYMTFWRLSREGKIFKNPNRPKTAVAENLPRAGNFTRHGFQTPRVLKTALLTTFRRDEG